MTSSAIVAFGDIVRLATGREAVVLESGRVIFGNEIVNTYHVRVIGTCGIEVADILRTDIVAILRPTFTQFVNYYNV